MMCGNKQEATTYTAFTLVGTIISSYISDYIISHKKHPDADVKSIIKKLLTTRLLPVLQVFQRDTSFPNENCATVEV